MRMCFTIVVAPHMIAILDLIEDRRTELPTFWVTRVNTPAAFRKQGYGTKLMKEVCEEADNENVALCLEVLPSGGEVGLNARQLVSWYKKFGFVSSHFNDRIMTRQRRQAYDSR